MPDILDTFDTTAEVTFAQGLTSDLSSSADVDWIRLGGDIFQNGILSLTSDGDLTGASIVIYRDVDWDFYRADGTEFRQFELIATLPADGAVFSDYLLQLNPIYSGSGAAAGTYAAITGFTGDYTLSLADFALESGRFDAAADDYSGPPTAIIVGQIVDGEIDFALDEDEFSLSLTSGMLYQLNFLGVPADYFGDFEIKIETADGSSFVAWESPSYYGYDGALEFSVDTTGDYTVIVTTSGEYDGPLEFEDYVNQNYSFQISDNGSFTPDGGLTQETAETLSLDTTHQIQIGGAVARQHWFDFEGEEGARYAIRVEGGFARVEAPTGVDIQDYASALRTFDGRGHGFVLTDVLEAAGDFDFTVFSYSEHDLVNVTITEVTDVVGDSLATATTIEVGDSFADSIQPGDEDHYTFDIVEGETYTVTMTPDNWVANSDSISLMTNLAYSDGDADDVFATWAENYSALNGERVYQFIATQDATVEFWVDYDGYQYTGYGDDGTRFTRIPYWGDYTLSVTNDFSDDRANVESDLVSPLELDVQTAALSDGFNDEDGFAIQVEAGSSYTFTASIGSQYTSVYRTDPGAYSIEYPFGFYPEYIPVRTGNPHDDATYQGMTDLRLAETMFIDITDGASATTVTFVADYTGYVMINMDGMHRTGSYDVLVTQGDPTDAQLAALGLPTSGDDILTGTGEVDEISGRQGNDTIYGLEGNDELYGDDGDDRIYSGSGNDIVSGGAGNDYVRVGGGAESFDGGSGTDYISYYDSTNGITADLAANTISGSWAVNDTINSFEGISGSRTGDDEIYGTSGSNIIRTYGGDDRVYARGGTDTVELGSGNDYVRVGGGVESFDGGSGTDYISYYDSANGITANLAENTISGSWAVNDSINSFESISGSRTGDDEITGTSGDNVIRTYGGDDRVYSGAGDDRVYLGSGDDYVRAGGEGYQSFYGGSGYDYVSYYDSPGIVNIDLEADAIGVSDPIEFADSFAIGDIVRDFEGASGTNGGNDRMYGTSGANTLKGWGGDDKLYGRSGDDKLYGGSGEDRFDGGAGTDRLWGGSGEDTFHLDFGEGHDIIEDFENNLDVIQLDNFTFGAGQDAFDFATQVGDDVVFDFGGGDGLTVLDATIGQLTIDLVLV
jgi:Ca2+-binding RTX toxin-like protein